MLPLKIAYRFLRTSPVQSGLIVAGIAVGIAVQIFVGSLITSLQQSLLDTTIGSAPHVTLQAPKDGDPVRYSPKMKRALSIDERVKAVVPVRQFPALYVRDKDTAPVTVLGGTVAELDRIYKIEGPPRLIRGEAVLGQNDALVGREFAQKWILGPGDEVTLQLPGGRSARLTIRGVYDLGTAAVNERQIFASAAFAAGVLGFTPDEYSQVQVQLTDPFDSGPVTRSLAAQLAGVKEVDWQVTNAELLTALQSQSSSSYMIQTFVLIAVALGIASTLAISAVQKTRQIGILKAMGMDDRRAGAIFLWSAAILGLAGTVTGILLGLGLIALFALAPLTFDVVPEPAFVAISAAVGIAVALLSAVIPTRKTSRLDPIEVIQGG